jgi:hypothetical protein
MFATEAVLYLLTVSDPQLIQPKHGTVRSVIPCPLKDWVIAMRATVGCDTGTLDLIDKGAEDLGRFQDHLVEALIVERASTLTRVLRDGKDIHFTISSQLS